jgi:Flp pilus assembly protein protease CpaA
MSTWIFVSAALLIASVFDIRTKEVPDFLSYSFIILGLVNGAFGSIILFSYKPFLFSALGFLAMLALSLLLFYTGQWGGGDSKLLMGVGAWLGLSWETGFPIIASFLVNMVLVGGAYGLIWALYLILKNFQSFRKEFVALLRASRRVRYMIGGAAILISALSYFLLDELFLRITLTIAPLMLFLCTYLWVAAKAVEKSCFYKWVEPRQLTEGDWIVEPIKYRGKIVVKPADFGVTKEQMAMLAKLEKEGKVRKVLIKEGIPFVPSIFIAGLVTLAFSNWFLP